MKEILVVVSGSVAAYKSAYIVAGLAKNNNVNVIMTKSACKFITPFQLQCLSSNYVAVDLVNESTLGVEHVELAKKADVIIVVPATANIIGKIAGGIADDMASTTLIVESKAKKYFAPAMNNQMYNNPIVKRNIKILQEVGWQEIEPRIDYLTNGDKAIGALAFEDEIIKKVVGVDNDIS